MHVSDVVWCLRRADGGNADERWRGRDHQMVGRPEPLPPQYSPLNDMT